MERVVLDAAVALTWCYQDEGTEYGSRILDTVAECGATVPSIWRLEIANALLVGERSGRLTALVMADYLDALNDLPIEIDNETASRALSDVSAIARRHGLAAYDGAYLELALRRNLPIATLDRDLLRAAEAAGVAVIR